MATLTVKILNPDEEERIMEKIINSISRQGFYRKDITDKVTFEDLAANYLVQFNIITRKVEKGLSKNDPDYYEYNEGEKFVEANLRGPYQYIEDKKKELNPSKTSKAWKNPATVRLHRVAKTKQ